MSTSICLYYYTYVIYDEGMTLFFFLDKKVSFFFICNEVSALLVTLISPSNSGFDYFPFFKV